MCVWTLWRLVLNYSVAEFIHTAFWIRGGMLMLCCGVPPGRIRSKTEVDESAADSVLSLNIISAKNIKSSHNSNRYLINHIYSVDTTFQGLYWFIGVYIDLLVPREVCCWHSACQFKLKHFLFWNTANINLVIMSFFTQLPHVDDSYSLKTVSGNIGVCVCVSLTAQWNHCMTISILTAVDCPVNLLIVSVAWLSVLLSFRLCTLLSLRLDSDCAQAFYW